MTDSFRAIADRMEPNADRRVHRLRGTVEAGTQGFVDHREKGLLPFHRSVSDSPIQSLRTVVDRHEPESTVHRFLWYNAFLLDANDESEQIEERATELGRLVDDRYDVAALCEVFEDSELETIRGELDGFDEANGPGPGLWWLPTFGQAKSAGLNTVVRDSPGTRTLDGAVGTKSTAFDHQGSKFTDSDAWANKGVLYSPIDVGVGVIDLFTTHLFAGGGLPWSSGDLLGIEWGSTEAERMAVRFAQLRELLSFVNAHRHPDHVTVVAGDFNISANSSYYEQLCEEMAAHDLYDAWPVKGGAIGATTFSVDDYGWSDVCRFTPGEDGPSYRCADYETDAPEPERDDRHRIDYLFVEEPRADHAFDLDLTRIRRLSGWRGSGGDQTAGDPDAFFRDLEEKENPKYLSDHFGLDVQFIASPRQP